MNNQKIKRAVSSSLMIRIALSYSAFLFACLLLLVYIYTSDIQNSKEEFWAQNKSVLQSSVNLIDSDILIMDTFCRQLSQNSNFMRLARMADNSDNTFYITAYKIKSTISSYFITSTLLPGDKYFIFLRNSNYILSINQFESAELYYNGIRNFSPDSYDSWLRLLDEDYVSGSMYPMTDYSDRSKDNYMYILDADALSYKTIEATVGFEVNSEKLRLSFGGLELADGAYLLVTDTEGGQMFLLSDDAEFTSDDSLLASLTYQNDFGSFKKENKLMHVTHLTSSGNGWKYYLVQPDSIATAYSNSRYLSIVLLIVGGLTGLGLLFLLVRNITRPVYQLDGRLKEAITDNEQLQEEIEHQKPLILNSYIRQLLLGDINTSDEMDYIRDYMQLPGDHLYYNVLYMVVYNNEDSKTSDNLPQLLQDALMEYLSSPLTGIYLYSPAERIYAVLLTFAEEAAGDIITIQEKVLKLHNYLLDTHGIWLFSGLGRQCDSLSNVWEAYQQASDAASYTAKNYIFLPYEIIKKDSSVFYYPSELSTKLIHFITSGNKDQVTALFDLIHQENMEERSLPVSMLKFLLSDIRNTLLKARFSVAAVSAEAQTRQQNVDRLFEDHLSFKLCEDIALELCDIFNIGKDSNDLIGNIEKYIQENFRDPSLCLNKISDEFTISESYFSHLFKEKCKVNFSVYLENIRLTEAARRLEGADCNISELYLEVGYNNPTSFRRAFKKKYGVAPSALRSAE